METSSSIFDGVYDLSANNWASAYACWTNLRSAGGLEHVCDVILLGLAARLGRPDEADAIADYYRCFAPEDSYLLEAKASARLLLEHRAATELAGPPPRADDRGAWRALGRQLLSARYLDAAEAAWAHLAGFEATRAEAYRRLIQIEGWRGDWRAIGAIAGRAGYVADDTSGRAVERSARLLAREAEPTRTHLKRFFGMEPLTLLHGLSERASVLQPRVKAELAFLNDRLGRGSSGPSGARIGKPADMDRTSAQPKPDASIAARVRDHLCPSIAVVIATRDRPDFLRQCLTSVLRQTEPPHQVVVVDDGSEADLTAIRAEFGARLPLVWVRQRHSGVAAARNRAADETSATWTCIMDDDDVMLPNRLRDHRVSLVDSSVGVSHGGWINFDASRAEATLLAGKNVNEDVILHAGRALTHGAAMIRTDLIRRHRYDEGLAAGVDFDLFSRLVAAGTRFSHTRSYVLLRRLHQSRLGAVTASRSTQVDVRASSVAQRLREKGLTDASPEVKERARQVPMVPLVTIDIEDLKRTIGAADCEFRVPVNRKLSRCLAAVQAIVERAPDASVMDDNPLGATVTLCVPLRESTSRDLLAVAASLGQPFGLSVPSGQARRAAMTLALTLRKDAGLRIEADGLAPLLHVMERSRTLASPWVIGLKEADPLSPERSEELEKLYQAGSIVGAARQEPGVTAGFVEI